MFPRKNITQEVLQRLPEHDRPGLSVAMKTWWRDVRKNHTGMRLTEAGHLAFQSAGYICYSFSAPDAFYPSRLLLLNQKLNCAYYLQARHQMTQLFLYGEEMSMVCALYSDWAKFVAYLQRL